jgi:hypothetical protein
VGKPAGPTRGTAFDHVGFAVPNVPAIASKLAAAGYQETTGREPSRVSPHQRHRARRQCMDALRIFSVLTE